MTKKIIDILSKYQNENWCYDITVNIDKTIYETIKQLRNMRISLSDKLHDITQSDQIENYNICNDILDDIKTITQLIKHFEELKQNTIAINSILFDERLNIFVIDDNLCPECTVKLFPLCIDYQKNISNKIESDMLDCYECQCCKRLFVMEYDISNNDFSDTNITINFQYLKHNNQISFHDIIVLTNVISCTTKEHHLNDVLAQIPIFNTDGNISFIRLNISYCNTCNKYIMLKSDFKQIEGIIACKVIDQTVTRIKNDSDDIEIKQYESILYQYGYNVKTKDNLSDKQRHLILAAVVESNILTREQICSHLDTLIERGGKIEKWELATQKWKQDRHFVKKYNVKSLPTVLIDKVVLKYSKFNQLSLNV